MARIYLTFICGSYNDGLKNSDYVAHSHSVTMSSELNGMWKEAVLVWGTTPTFICQARRCPDGVSNPQTPDYKEEAKTLETTSLYAFI
jgi:hypothetical protein